MAAAVGADAVAYRLAHLSDPRLAAVLEAVSQRAGWDPRPSPRPDRTTTGVASGRGVACGPISNPDGLRNQVEGAREVPFAAVRVKAALQKGSRLQAEGPARPAVARG